MRSILAALLMGICALVGDSAVLPSEELTSDNPAALTHSVTLVCSSPDQLEPRLFDVKGRPVVIEPERHRARVTYAASWYVTENDRRMSCSGIPRR